MKMKKLVAVALSASAAVQTMAAAAPTVSAEDVIGKSIGFSEIGDSTESLTYKLSISSNIKGGSIGFILPTGVSAEAVSAGEEITVTVNANEGYKLDTLTVNGANVASSVRDGKYIFMMPEADVLISASFVAEDYTVTVEAGKNGTTTVDKKTAKMGDKVTVNAAPAKGYAIDKVTLDGTAITGTDGAYSFTMPAKNVTVAVSYKAIAVEKVALDKTTASLEKGETVTLKATVTPAEALNKNVTWKTSNAKVATVKNGVVTAVGNGTATITVTTEDGAKTATCKVTVTTSVKSVSLDKTTATVQEGKTLTLKATVNPEDASNKNVTWTTSDAKVATVKNGVVTALKTGTAKITVTTEDGKKTATCTITVKCAAPENLKATASHKKITLKWDAVEGATKYRIQQFNGTGWTTVKYADETSAVIENLTNKTEYKFRVVAYKDGAWGLASDDIAATPYMDIAPKNVKITADNKKVTISWDAVKGATKYRIYQLIDGKWATVKYTTGTSITIDGLTNKTEYKFRVTVCVDGEWGTKAETVAATPFLDIMPKNVKITADSKKVTLSWNAVKGATKYRIYQLIDGKWTTVKYTANTSIVIDGLTNGTAYQFKIKAYAEGEWSDATAAVKATPVLAGPASVKAVTASKKVILSWNAVKGATKYRIQQVVNGAWKTVDYTTDTTVEITGLTDKTAYRFRVLAYVGEWSEPSAVIKATPKPGAAPAGIKTTVNDKTVTISWNAIAGATKYRVQQYVDGAWKTVAYPETTSYTVKNLTNGTAYKFRVIAYANGEWGYASSAVTATPKIQTAPQNVTATAGNKTVTIKWNAVNNATKYRVQQLSGTSWKTVAYPTATSFTASSLTNGTKYTYRVLAYVNGAWGEVSETVTATPKA